MPKNIANTIEKMQDSDAVTIARLIVSLIIILILLANNKIDVDVALALIAGQAFPTRLIKKV